MFLMGETLIKHFNSKDQDLRAVALQTMFLTGESSLWAPVLPQVQKDPSLNVRLVAVLELKKLLSSIHSPFEEIGAVRSFLEEIVEEEAQSSYISWDEVGTQKKEKIIRCGSTSLSLLGTILERK
jgi:vesicle coat complex subunit